MKECNTEQLEFYDLGRLFISRFDGGRMSSEQGGVLLREANIRMGVTRRLRGCFTDYRTSNSWSRWRHLVGKVPI